MLKYYKISVVILYLVDEEATMTQWEYCIVEDSFDRGYYSTTLHFLGTGKSTELDFEKSYEALAELGRQGWELVSVTLVELRDPPDDYTRGERTNLLYDCRTYYLKRPIG